MKSIKLVIHEPAINKIIGTELNLLLHEKASVIDAIAEADRMISSKGVFPVPDYRSLLHMVYNPIETRFHKQVAMMAYKKGDPAEMLNVRDHPKQQLPNDATVVLIPSGGCISEWEEAIDYDRFRKTVSSDNEDSR